MKRAGSMLRLGSLVAAAALVAIGVRVNAKHRREPIRFDLVEATIGSIQQAIDDDVITPEQLVGMYLQRIAVYDGKQTATHLNSYIAVDREAGGDGKKGHKGPATGAGTTVTTACWPGFRSS